MTTRAFVDGEWKDNDGQIIAKIESGQVIWNDGAAPANCRTYGFQDRVVSMTIGEETFVGSIQLDGNSISWSDGEMWYRVGEAKIPERSAPRMAKEYHLPISEIKKAEELRRQRNVDGPGETLTAPASPKWQRMVVQPGAEGETAKVRADFSPKGLRPKGKTGFDSPRSPRREQRETKASSMPWMADLDAEKNDPPSPKREPASPKQEAGKDKPRRKRLGKPLPDADEPGESVAKEQEGKVPQESVSTAPKESEGKGESALIPPVSEEEIRDPKQSSLLSEGAKQISLRRAQSLDSPRGSKAAKPSEPSSFFPSPSAEKPAEGSGRRRSQDRRRGSQESRRSERRAQSLESPRGSRRQSSVGASRRLSVETSGTASRSRPPSLLPQMQFEVCWVKAENQNPRTSQMVNQFLIGEDKVKVANPIDMLEECIETLFSKEPQHMTHYVATGGAVPVNNYQMELCGALGAAMWGLVRCARIELPTEKLVLVDDVSRMPPAAPKTVAKQKLESVDGVLSMVADESITLVSEMDISCSTSRKPAADDTLEIGDELECALSNGRLYVPRLRSWQTPQTADNEIQSLNIITGGTSGIAGALGKFIVDCGADHLCLLSRSARGTRSKWPGSDCVITTHACDVADEDQMKDFVVKLKTSYQASKRSIGVFHLAGFDIAMPGNLIRRPELEKAWRGKVDGIATLHHVFQEMFRQGARYTLFSNAAATFGNPGQICSAAANAAMDGLAHVWPLTCSVQWGPWNEVGNVKKATLQRLAKRGLEGIACSVAFHALATILHDNKSSLVTVSLISWPRFQQSTAKFNELFFSEIEPSGRFVKRSSFSIIAERAAERQTSFNSDSQRPRAGSIGSGDSDPALDRRFRLALLVNGSLGDVTPFIGLAKLLAKSRFTVRILTNKDHVDLCLKHKVQAIAVFPSISDVLVRMGGNPDMGFAEGARRATKIAAQWLAEHPHSIASVDDVLFEFKPDALVFSPQSSGPALSHEKFYGAPAICLHIFRQSLDLFEQWLFREPLRPTFLATSPLLDTEELPEKALSLHQVGAIVLEDEPSESYIKENYPGLFEFVMKGPPVCITWGSLLTPTLSPWKMLKLALEALMLIDSRGVILGGIAKLHEVFMTFQAHLNDPEIAKLYHYGKEKCFFLPEAPHQWLFKHCECVIHHGGAGTTHSALRCGLPAVITPAYMDQFEISDAINSLGAGMGFPEDKSLASITPKELGAAVVDVLRMSGRCKELSKFVQEEASRSKVRTAEILEEFLMDEVSSGAFEAKMPSLPSDIHLYSKEAKAALLSDSFGQMDNTQELR